MDPVEEQQQELEVLESIYPDELVKHSDTEFDVKIPLDTSSKRNHTLILSVKYPPEYPNVLPELELDVEEYDEEEEEDSDEDEDERANKRNLNLPELVEFGPSDIEIILSKLNEEADLQLGIPSIFALVTIGKDEGEQLFRDKLDALEKTREEELVKQEAELSKKFIGTKVTPESFTKWREQFREEMGIDSKLEEFYKAQHNGKMSGREIFEKGLANEDDLLDQFELIKVN